MRISIENFGPIASASIDLRPLTIFIGPNNTGKSYAGLLLYALFGSLGGSRGRRSVIEPLVRVMQEMVKDARIETAIEGLKSSSLGLADVQDLVRETGSSLRRCLSNAAEPWGEALGSELRYYFGVQTPSELVRAGSGKAPLSIRVQPRPGAKSFVRYRIRKDSPEVEAATHIPSLTEFTIPERFLSEVSLSSGSSTSLLTVQILQLVWFSLLDQLDVPVFSKETCYLPPSRSGLLQAWQGYVSLALDRASSFVGIEPVQIPAFSGVTNDFLRTLVERIMNPPTGRRSQLPEASRILRQQLFRGDVEISKRRGSAAPEIVYDSASGAHVPISRASSLVGELAPLALWMDHVLGPEDMLIMDEPEAHLHPEAQRIIARILVRLVNSGVRVLFTTHSSTLLHQISNHIVADAIPESALRKLGYGREDTLGASEVSVSLFAPGRSGTRVSPVSVSQEDGISENEFLRVAEMMGDETYNLYSSYPVSGDHL